MEIEEWTHINRDLRQHGLPAVDLLEPLRASQESDAVTLSADTARSLRLTLSTLIRDCDRRQELIQELIVTNNQLRDELKEQVVVSEKYENKTRDLRNMLDDSQARLQEFEEEDTMGGFSSLTVEEEDRLRNTKTLAAERCAELNRECKDHTQTIDRLQERIRRLTSVQEERDSKRDAALQRLHRKWAKSGPSVNEDLVTVIDWYEEQLRQLKQDMTSHTADITDDLTNTEDNSGTVNFKTLIKSYDRQLRDNKKKMKGLENEKELMKLELESRPQLRDLREMQAKLRRMEQAMKRQGLCPSHGVDKRAGLSCSTAVEDLDFLPAAQSLNYLKMTCSRLGLTDLRNLETRLDKMSQDHKSLPSLQRFSRSVLQVVNDATGKPTNDSSHLLWCEKTWHHVIPTISDWSEQMQAHQELQESIHNIAALLFPWRQLHCHDNPTTSDLVTMLDSLLDKEGDSGSDRGKSAHKQEQPRSCNRGRTGHKQEQPRSCDRGRTGHKQEQPSQEMLQEIVDHFQTLFDVPSVAGVYTRMNDVYVKLGEVHNIMKTLKSVLGLEPDSVSSVVVDEVGRLCQSQQDDISQQLRARLQDTNIHSALQKLEDYDEFVPVFKDLLQILLHTLNVSHLDQVIPAIKALKLLASS